MSSTSESGAAPGAGRRAWLALPPFLLLSLAAGGAAALWPVDAWYFELRRPPWTPPGWLFGPAWTLLYVLIGISVWRVWRVGGLRRDRVALALFASQWALNVAWTGLFFGLERPDLALGEIVVLLALIAATALRFRRHDGPAAWLLVPYLGWVAFATALNAAFWWLNRA